MMHLGYKGHNPTAPFTTEWIYEAYIHLYSYAIKFCLYTISVKHNYLQRPIIRFSLHFMYLRGTGLDILGVNKKHQPHEAHECEPNENASLMHEHVIFLE